MQVVEMIKHGVRLSPTPAMSKLLPIELMIVMLMLYTIRYFRFSIKILMILKYCIMMTSGSSTFTSLLFKLSQPENQLLQWTVF